LKKKDNKVVLRLTTLQMCIHKRNEYLFLIIAKFNLENIITNQDTIISWILPHLKDGKRGNKRSLETKAAPVKTILYKLKTDAQ